MRARRSNRVPAVATGGYVGVQMDGDDALVRRIVDAAAMPALLAREGATALLEACDAQAAVLFVQAGPGRCTLRRRPRAAIRQRGRRTGGEPRQRGGPPRRC